MYNNITKCFFIILFLTTYELTLADGGELWIHYNSTSSIWVHVYPISMVFNNDFSSSSGRNYNLLGWSKVWSCFDKIDT